MAVTAADYRWFPDWRPDWAQAYCLTVISDITVDDALARLGARDVAVAHGFDDFYQRAVHGSLHGYDPFDTLVGAIDAGQSSVLLIEVNGFVGVTERLIGPLAPRRTIVALFRNVNAVYRLHWWRDGRLLLDVDLLFPAARFGADPDALLHDMTEVGLGLDDPVGTGGADVSGSITTRRLGDRGAAGAQHRHLRPGRRTQRRGSATLRQRSLRDVAPPHRVVTHPPGPPNASTGGRSQ